MYIFSMPKYSYLVVNQDNQQLNGTIGAPDEQSARHELNELGFSVVSMQEIKESEAIQESQLPTFEFAAIDKNQKRVVGTIQSEDDFSAYKRLISEYAFEVEYIIDNGLAEEEKIKARKKGADYLQEKLEEEQNLNTKPVQENDKVNADFALKQQVLNDQIAFVLSKVKELLDTYEAILKPETKDQIRKFVDKLLRIKTSTNLDYIRKTAEELLQFIQQEEIFINEQEQQQEKAKVMLDMKSMMFSLKKTKNTAQPSITELVTAWYQKHVIENANPNFFEKILGSIFSASGLTKKEPDEVMALKSSISQTNEEILHLLQMYLQAKDTNFKNEAWNKMKLLRQNRKNLKLKLKNLQHDLKIIPTKTTSAGPAKNSKLTQELLNFSGWLLAFYLIYYFIGIYASQKNFSLILGNYQTPAYLMVYKTVFIKYFLSTIFLLHAALSLKQNFFKKSALASLLLLPGFILGSILIYLNF